MGRHDFIWYYRSLPQEEPIPFQARILHQDEHLIAVDKPHFLPTTPGGRFIQQSALVRLRNQTGIDELVPMHRLDRATAGVILFAVNPQTRGAYQSLFERREIRKGYQAVVPLAPGAGLETGKVLQAGDIIAERSPAQLRELIQSLPLDFANRMTKVKGQLRSIVQDGEPNARTRISLAALGRSAGHFSGLPVALLDLDPLTGKTHQLRVHLASLGLGIINDAFYPGCGTWPRMTTTVRCSCWPSPLRSPTAQRPGAQFHLPTAAAGGPTGRVSRRTLPARALVRAGHSS